MRFQEAWALASQCSIRNAVCADEPWARLEGVLFRMVMEKRDRGRVEGVSDGRGMSVKT